MNASACVNQGDFDEISPAVDEAGDFEELLARSSLGTDEAIAAREVGAQTLAEFRAEAEQQGLTGWPNTFSFTAKTYRLAGQRLESQGNSLSAEPWYRSALINEFDGETATRLAAILECKGRRAEALSWYIRAADRGYPSASLRLAVLCAVTNHKDAANLMRCIAESQLDLSSRRAIRRYVVSNRRQRLKQAVVTKNPEAMYHVAAWLHIDDEPAAAYRCYSASLQYIYSLGVLGMTSLGWANGVESPEERRSREWFKDRCEHLKQTVEGRTEQALWSQKVSSEPGNDLDDLVTAVTTPGLVTAVATGAGKTHTIEDILRWIRPLVVRYCRARVGGEKTFASADDVAQEVCLAVLTALPSYRDYGRPFLSFVYGIAAHKVAEAHRNAARNRADLVLELPDTPELADGPEAQVLQSELTGRMAKLLHNLPERQREILILRVVVGLSAEETAEAVGSTPGAVRVAQHRALSRLRNVLASESCSREWGGDHVDISPERDTSTRRRPRGYRDPDDR
jgi:RNA polymerase sigma-70 factor (ECF subfamily)